jgi:hypothetical protein
VVLEGNGVSQDTANVILSGGQISIQGFQHRDNTFRLAVDGGTGRYANVRGEVTVITIELTP